MNERMQELICKELGLIGTIALTGTILVTCIFPDNTIAITLLFGAVTSIIGALSAFLNTKNMSEKQDETLEKYYINKTLNNNDEITIGSIGFDTKEEMSEYLKNHTVEDMITDADLITYEAEDDVQ